MSHERVKAIKKAWRCEQSRPGKTAIPESILNKPGALDDEESAFVRSHTLIDERIVAAAPSPRATRNPPAIKPRTPRRQRVSRPSRRR
jgi:response regulator RpfG family c-di-GMP phosphodiesterase